jgi:sec-independent protein translocase protein TatB
MHCRFSLPGSMMKRMSFSETIFLFFLALIIFGPKKLPEIARQVGKALNEFRRASNEFKAQIEQEIAHLEVEKKPEILPPNPPPEGTASRTLNSASSETLPANVSSTESYSASAEAAPVEARPAEAPATLAASSEEPAAKAIAAEPATEALPAAAEVTSSTSQESHV